MKAVYIFLISLIFYFICSPLRSISIYYSAIIESIIYSFATYLLLKKYSKEYHIISIIVYIILGRIIIELPIRLMNIEETLITLMVTISVILSTIFTGIIYYSRNIYVTILLLLSESYCVFIGHKNWLNYINFGTLPQIETASYIVQTSENEINLDTINSNYILLDFWNSSCGVCIQQFPRFQKLYDKYKNEILIRSVFVRHKKDEKISDGTNFINKLGYKFHVWSVDINSSLVKDFNIKVYPTVIIIDHDKHIIFKGNLNEAEEKIRNTFNR
ncbi:TlpA disulfide reductase family protein [Phocaeicola barnesiae]|uniref:TlpA family protein disulfide reductase n=1 Tax=Phocaeicola barnesiae TaxID=376804 RepID=UPI0025A34438|nr:TlpA disulfide reductase family protein [Phocaeicola barnesiae]MDM8234283.1 TlpA disulfide reductase family protein [Phocaeicola barnesiae]